MMNEQLDKFVDNDQNIEPLIRFEVNPNELNMIFAAIQELPHRAVDGLIRKLFEQANAQVKR